MNIIIAGGAGFIGRHLNAYLNQQGHKVFVFDNLITSKMPSKSMCDFFLLDVSNMDKIVACDDYLPEKIDRIYHLASPASPKKYTAYPRQTIMANTVGTDNLLRLAYTKGARFLFASTSEIYGDPQVPVQKETYNGNVDPNNDRSVYDEAKRLGETIVSMYQRNYGIDTKIVRIFNTYGPGMQADDGRVIPNFITRALRGETLQFFDNGKQTRSFCYIDDTVEGLVRLMESDHMGPINIGNPNEYMSIIELAQAVIDIVGWDKSSIEYIPAPTRNDPFIRRPDITLAQRVLGWDPKVDINTGLKATVEYFRGMMGR